MGRATDGLASSFDVAAARVEAEDHDDGLAPHRGAHDPEPRERVIVGEVEDVVPEGGGGDEVSPEGGGIFSGRWLTASSWR